MMTDESEGEQTPDHYELVLAFDSNSDEFVRGFELGCLWLELGMHPEDKALCVNLHAMSAEMILRIAEAMHRPVRSKPVVIDGRELEEWLHVTFGAVV